MYFLSFCSIASVSHPFFHDDAADKVINFLSFGGRFLYLRPPSGRVCLGTTRYNQNKRVWNRIYQEGRLCLSRLC